MVSFLRQVDVGINVKKVGKAASPPQTKYRSWLVHTMTTLAACKERETCGKTADTLAKNKERLTREATRSILKATANAEVGVGIENENENEITGQVLRRHATSVNLAVFCAVQPRPLLVSHDLVRVLVPSLCSTTCTDHTFCLGTFLSMVAQELPRHLCQDNTSSGITPRVERSSKHNRSKWKSCKGYG